MTEYILCNKIIYLLNIVTNYHLNSDFIFADQ